MTERVVAAALAALPRRRRPRLPIIILAAVGAAIALVLGLLIAPSSSSHSENLPKGPLAFTSVGRGTVELDDWGSSWVFTVARASLGGNLALGARVRALVDAVDLRTHLAVVVVVRDRDSVTVRRITVRRYSRTKLQFCVRAAVPSVPLGRLHTFAYDVVQVRKTRGIVNAIPDRDPGGFPLGLDFQPFILRDQAGRILAPQPIGKLKVSLCPK